MYKKVFSKTWLFAERRSKAESLGLQRTAEVNAVSCTGYPDDKGTESLGGGGASGAAGGLAGLRA
ncbi:hypothetical protein, partial [Thermodesulfitimonas sp.]